jgi:hypothetical protein
VSVTVKASFRPAPTKGRRRIEEPDPTLPEPLPRIARLMAIAIVVDEMVRAGETTYAEVARAAGVSRARVSQVMRLIELPSTIQYALIHAGCASQFTGQMRDPGRLRPQLWPMCNPYPPAAATQ